MAAIQKALGIMVLATVASSAFPAIAQKPPEGTGAIERRLAEGWQVAGFIAASDIRTLILLRNPAVNYLVQCSVLIDVTLKERVRIGCYELH